MTTEQTLEQSVIDAISEWVGETSSDHLVAAARAAVAALRAAGEPVAATPEPTLTTLQEEQILMGFHNPPDEPAPSASVQEALEQCIRICMEEASEWDSDRLQNYKNYAGHCANRISTEVLATPSPLMAAGGAETSAQVMVDRDLLRRMLGYARNASCPFSGQPEVENWHSRIDADCRYVDAILGVPALESVRTPPQPSQIDAAARASETVEAVKSCPYADCQECILEINSIGPCLCANPVDPQWEAAVEATSPAKRDYAARVVTDGSFQEGDEIAYEVNEATGIGRVTSHTRTAAEPTRATDANRAEALHGADLGRWCYEHPNLAAITIESLRGQTAEPTREEIAAIIERHITHDEALNMAAAILALKPRGGTTREETIEECAKVCEAHWSNYKRNYSSACADNALSETGMERVLTVIGAQADTADLLASHLRALSKPRGEPAREGGK